MWHIRVKQESIQDFYGLIKVKKPFGKPKHRWEVNFKFVLKV
jgi:hypothetical protein